MDKEHQWRVGGSPPPRSKKNQTWGRTSGSFGDPLPSPFGTSPWRVVATYLGPGH